MEKTGKVLGLISPILAVGMAALMLSVLDYGYQSGSCVTRPGSLSSGSECTFESGTVSTLRYALQEGDPALFYWAGCVVVLCLIAAVGALVGRTALVWIAAIALYVLAVLGMVSIIGLFIFPLAVVLFVSAVLLTVARYGSRGA